jgi:hypothetical protein
LVFIVGVFVGVLGADFAAVLVAAVVALAAVPGRPAEGAFVDCPGAEGTVVPAEGTYVDCPRAEGTVVGGGEAAGVSPASVIIK